MIGILFDSRKSPTTIASDLISLDLEVMSDEVHEWSNDVTENPVELGSPVADHIQPKADKLTITGWISDAPLDHSFLDSFSGFLDNSLYSARLQTHFELLRALMDARAPLIVYTRFKTYTDMALVSCNISRSTGTGEALPFTLNFMHIRLVATQTVDVPPGISKKLDKKADASTAKKAQPKANNGKVEANEVSEPKRQRSVLSGLLQ